MRLRFCPSCGYRLQHAIDFFDTPIHCPICDAVFKVIPIWVEIKP